MQGYLGALGSSPLVLGPKPLCGSGDPGAWGYLPVLGWILGHCPELFFRESVLI